jgi:hypothetical protein
MDAVLWALKAETFQVDWFIKLQVKVVFSTNPKKVEMVNNC